MAIIKRLKIKIYNTIIIVKPQKKSALSSNSIDKYKYLIGDKMQPSNQIQVVGKAKSPYSPLEKAFEKRTKI